MAAILIRVRNFPQGAARRTSRGSPCRFQGAGSSCTLASGTSRPRSESPRPGPAREDEYGSSILWIIPCVELFAAARQKRGFVLPPGSSDSIRTSLNFSGAHGIEFSPAPQVGRAGKRAGGLLPNAASRAASPRRRLNRHAARLVFARPLAYARGHAAGTAGIREARKPMKNPTRGKAILSSGLPLGPGRMRPGRVEADLMRKRR